jgi:hypothetical protein
MLPFRCAEPFVRCCDLWTDQQEKARIAGAVLTDSLQVRLPGMSCEQWRGQEVTNT